jgi:hypothetical protein
MDSRAYFEAVTTSDEALRTRQRDIRRAEDAGHLTIREAADLLVAALSGHLAACRSARLRYLDGAR